ncbi:MAG: PorV/PorQ family protein [Ignavibacteriae bacterium]|nr:PorV/PorQ family protein [Ignavibacteriota bacterium]
MQDKQATMIPLMDIARLITLVVCVSVLSTTVYAGRGDKAGTAAASELLIPVDARSIALGSASIAASTGVEALYWNPAGLAQSQAQSGAMFSHMRYLADISLNYGAVSTTLRSIGKVGFSIKALSFGDISITTEDEPDGTGETTSPTFVILGATFSRQMADRIFVGITMNYIYEKMASVSATDIAFSAGVLYTDLGGVQGLRLGAAVKHIGPSMKYDGDGLFRTGQIDDVLRPSSRYKIEAAAADLPSSIEIGLSYTMRITGATHLNMMSAFQNNNFSNDEYKVGAEYVYHNLIFLRAGSAFASESEGREYIFGPSMGAGIKTMYRDVTLSIDYAYRSVKYFNGNHVVSVGLEF